MKQYSSDQLDSKIRTFIGRKSRQHPDVWLHIPSQEPKRSLQHVAHIDS
ncbi:MAG TPA: hypothetical protein PK096_00135 [Candidatus Saccharibacteria bacterium]|nr:hypothetical protein [Candidatus Saccharibacteria bacterium]HRK93763.1 hypothetical protein [Candidatus Saccharibacteria bacterium]